MDCAYLPVISTILGTIVGGAIGFYATIINNKIIAKRACANRLNAAFQSVILKILFQEISCLDEIKREIGPVFSTQINSISEFRFYISEKDIDKYDDACKKYYLFVRSHAPKAAIRQQGESTDGLTDTAILTNLVNEILYFASYKNT